MAAGEKNETLQL